MKVGIKELKYLIGEAIDESDFILEKRKKKKKKRNTSSKKQQSVRKGTTQKKKPNIDDLLGGTQSVPKNNPPAERVQAPVIPADPDQYLSPGQIASKEKAAKEDAASKESTRQAALSELQKNIKTIEKTTNFENFINSCDRASKLINDMKPDDSMPQFYNVTFNIPGEGNDTAPTPLKKFLKEYEAMGLEKPFISNPFSGKQDEYKLDEQNIKKILAATKKIIELYKDGVKEIDDVEGISDFNLLSRPGLFGIKPEDASKWRAEVKKYAREEASTPAETATVIETYGTIRKAAIGLIKRSKNIQELGDPNEFIKKYGALYRIIEKLLSKDPRPTNVNNVLYVNDVPRSPEESKQFISFVKSIVKSKPESSLTKIFSLARKYKVMSDQQSKDVGAAPEAERKDMEKTNAEKLAKIQSSIKKLVRSSIASDMIENNEDTFMFTEAGETGVQYSFIKLSENLYNIIFDDNKISQTFLDSDIVKQFYDKNEEEDVGKLPLSKEKQMKKAWQNIAVSLEQAYEAALSLQIIAKEPDRNKPISFTISGVTLEIPSFQDVMQGTVEPDRQKVKDFNASVQDIYDTSSDEDKSVIEKKHRVVSAIIAKYTKVYQVANRGILGKIFDTDTLSIGGGFGIPKFDLSHGFFGGKKVVETLLYGTPSKLLRENKREVSVLYAMAIRESLQDMKDEKCLGINNKHISLELDWLIEDIKRSNIEEDVLLYLRDDLRIA